MKTSTIPLESVGTFSWNPRSTTSMLAVGTQSYSKHTTSCPKSTLEIHKVNLNSHLNISSSSHKINTSSPFTTLLWGNCTPTKPYGMIAGGMETGELQFWNPHTILDRQSIENSLLFSSSTPTTLIRSLDFNLLRENQLASAGDHGEFHIWDLDKLETPYKVDTSNSRMDDIVSVAFNHMKAHIISTASSNGYTDIWDLRIKKSVMTLTSSLDEMNGSKRGYQTSTIAWHPSSATDIVSASDDDEYPVISLWDLRYPHSPKRNMLGHTKGIVDLSWCKDDAQLIASCSKDGQIISWNIKENKAPEEIWHNHQYTFSIDWCPHHPSILATSSADKSISLYSIHDETEESDDEKLSVDSFNTAKSDSSVEDDKPISHLECHRRPIGADFARDGKLITFHNSSSSSSSSKIKIRIINLSRPNSPQLDLGPDSNPKKILIQERLKHSIKKMDWEILAILSSENARERLIRYSDKSSGLMEKTREIGRLDQHLNEISFNHFSVKDSKIDARQTAEMGGQRHYTGVIPNTLDFSHSRPPMHEMTLPGAEAYQPNILLKQVEEHRDNDMPIDELIKHAVITGDFKAAVDICIASKRFTDAFLCAMGGGRELLEYTQNIYFEIESTKDGYLYFLKGIVQEDLLSIVNDTHLSEWSSVLAVICTYADPNHFRLLCSKLGHRLHDSPMAEFRRNSIICYLAAGDLPHVSNLWAMEVKEEKLKQGLAKDDPRYAVLLQEFIEKITTFRDIIEYEDSDLNVTLDRYELTSLYELYNDYAEIMMEKGKLDMAIQYRGMIPVKLRESKALNVDTADAQLHRNGIYDQQQKQNNKQTQQIYLNTLNQEPVNPDFSGPSDDNTSPLYPNEIRPIHSANANFYSAREK
ncbi:WD40-repeat-containing domain protein [Pilobolus umbonatus]|nr:WD40-repeat-containing domain protein [Pilobolus umbonatus]